VALLEVLVVLLFDSCIVDRTFLSRGLFHLLIRDTGVPPSAEF
jgi:hypothetical protein